MKYIFFSDGNYNKNGWNYEKYDFYVYKTVNPANRGNVWSIKTLQ